MFSCTINVVNYIPFLPAPVPKKSKPNAQAKTPREPDERPSAPIPSLVAKGRSAAISDNIGKEGPNR